MTKILYFAKHNHDILSIAQKHDKLEPRTTSQAVESTSDKTVVWISL